MIKNAAAGAFVGLALLGGCRPRDALRDDYQGVVEFDERLLAFEVPGRIEEVPARRGDLVKDGQLIAKLDDTLARLTRQTRTDEANAAQTDVALLEAGSRAQEISAAASDLAAAVAAETLASKTKERVATLIASGAVTPAELDRVQADFDRATATRKSVEQRLSALRQGARPQEISRARARLEVARSALDLEDARLARYELRAKTEGVVLDVHVEPGELASIGTPAATVADVAHPYVDVFVPEGRLAGIHVGTPADVRVDATPTRPKGVVEHLSPKTEFTPRFLFSERERPHLVIRVRVRVDDPNRTLHAGVPAFVRFSP